MLRRTKEIKEYTLGARDGDIGRVKDFYFDDQSWTIRYLIADTGKWLAWRRVLISPNAVRGFREVEKEVVVDLTKEQIENSPPIDHDKPVSRQYEMDYLRYYNYPFYWDVPGMWGLMPGPTYGQVTGPAPAASAPNQQGEGPELPGDPHLRSTQDVTGYYIQARDGLGRRARERRPSLYEALIEQQPLDTLMIPTDLEHLTLVPSVRNLTGAEVELVSVLAREYRLKEALAPVVAGFDYVLIDCPPSLGLLTLNALTAAQGVLVPMQCEFFALEGLSELTATLQRVKRVLNPELEIEGVLLAEGMASLLAFLEERYLPCRGVGAAGGQAHPPSPEMGFESAKFGHLQLTLGAVSPRLGAA